MTIKVFGFNFDITKAPATINIQQVLKSLAGTPTLMGELNIRHGVFQMPVKTPDGKRDLDWWAGIVLKVRDSKLFTMLTENQGKQILTTEMLKENQSLVEASFFVANPRTGAGLFAHHYQSAPLIGGFFPILMKEFKLLQEEIEKSIVEDSSLDARERKQKLKATKGFIWPSQLVLPQQFKQLVASMKKATTVTVKLSSVTSGHSLFRGCSFTPEKETREYKLPVDALPSELAESLSASIQNNEIKDARVAGLDRNGHEVAFWKDKNPYIFDVVDYDKTMAGFELDIENYVKTLYSSKIIAHLIKLSRGKTTWELLNRS